MRRHARVTRKSTASTARRKLRTFTCGKCRQRKEKEQQEKQLAKMWQKVSCSKLYFDRWRASVRVTYDSSVFTQKELFDVIRRAGVQIGVGVGRANAATGIDMGLGRFEFVAA